jgi:hypothetical protein
MKNVNKYKDILLAEFYLDENQEVRRSKDGYLNRFKKGDLAKFYKGTGGYLNIQIPQGIRRTVKKHELIWILNGKSIPPGYEIDHKDGDKTNNDISNLRLVDRKLNNRNRKKRSDNTSGVTGIRWSEYHKHYVIRRTVGDKRLSRSRKTFDEALKVLEELKQMDTSYTERHGK